MKPHLVERYVHNPVPILRVMEEVVMKKVKEALVWVLTRIGAVVFGACVGIPLGVVVFFVGVALVAALPVAGVLKVTDVMRGQ
jgi:hypothetical protein